MYYDPGRLEERIADLEAALKPFAKLGAALDGGEFNNLFEIHYGDVHAKVSMADLKEAASVLRA